MLSLCQAYAAQGWNVECPLLPGHGTRWEDLLECRWEDWEEAVQQAAARLRKRCSKVFAAGLSLGGTLVLRLAETDPELLGVIVINPGVLLIHPLMPLAGMLKHVVRSVPGIGSHIKDPAAKEVCYDRLPMANLEQGHRLVWVVRRDLPRLEQPLLIFKSRRDLWWLPSRNASLLLQRTNSRDKELVVLENSYHVATLDYDKGIIQDKSVAFIRRLARAR
jgi:carboxylesterase